jgi:hypothetical protein
MNKQPDGRNGQPQGYEAPVIQTFSQEEFLAVIGPAQGYNAGTHPGAPGGNMDRPRRVIVGMR